MKEGWKKMTEGFNQKTGITKFKQKTKEVFSKTAKVYISIKHLSESLQPKHSISKVLFSQILIL